MKTITRWLLSSVLAGLLVLAFIVPAAIGTSLLTGCAAVEPGNSSLVVRAEQTASIAVDTFDTLFLFEYQNRALLGPEFKSKVDNVRRNAPHAIDALRNATMAYKKNRTPEGKADLVTALAVLQTLQQQAASLFPQSKPAGPPMPPTQ